MQRKLFAVGKTVTKIPLLFIFSVLLWGGTSSAQDEGEPQEAPEPPEPEVSVSESAEDLEDQDDETEEETDLAATQSKEAEELSVAAAPQVRRFHEVLDELLAEFGYDIRTGQMEGLKNLAVRKVVVNDALPPSYKNYVELLVAERIRENSQIRLISCVSCKNRTSRVVDGRLVITSPTTNMDEMNRAAAQMGIDHFLDVVLVYHTTHMVLAFQAFDTHTKEMVWARTYNSETIKSRFQKLAIDYSQVEKSRPGEDYVPEFRYLVGAGGAGVPNVAGGSEDSGMLMLHFRGSEKFDNRHSEFGLILNIYQSTANLLSDYPTTGGTADEEVAADEVVEEETALEPFRSAIGLYMMYAYNFLGSIESYNTTRYGVNLGLGTLLASGYLAGSVRLGLDIYFGRTFGVTLAGLYVASSQVLVDNEYQDTKGGAGGELAVVYNF